MKETYLNSKPVLSTKWRKYRIVSWYSRITQKTWYTPQCWRWWFPFWVSGEMDNLNSSIEEAEHECVMHAANVEKNRVVKYL